MTNKSKNITSEDIKHIADLAFLELNNDQIIQYQTDLKEIINFMAEIKKLDLKSVLETSRISDEENVFRSDEITPSLSQKEATSNATSTYKGFFLVPHVLTGKNS